MKRIAILVETSLASGRQILSGISRFLKERNDLSAFHLSGQLGEMNPQSLLDWQGDGIIARVLDQDIADLLMGTGLPTVDVLGNVRGQPFPLVNCDNEAIGCMVAEQFIGTGFHHFGVISLREVAWAEEREAAFLKTAGNYGKICHVLHLASDKGEQVNLTASMARIRDWLSSVPKPLAILVASDQFAPLLFEAAHLLGIRIPEDLSVIGVDNDAPYCDLCRPTLSSVSPNHEKVGYQAAQLLDAIIDGGNPESAVIKVAPDRIQLRRSSSFLAVDDSALAKALEYIRTHATESPSIDEIAAHSGLSRSVLQRRFRSQLNRSVGSCVLNEKLNYAKELLKATDLPMSLVAEKSGFTGQEYMNRIFRKHLRQTSGQFRKF